MKSPRQNPIAPKMFFSFVLVIAAIAIAYAVLHQNSWSWPVPEDAKQLKNPLQPGAAVLESARPLYREKCAQCHGDTGRGDGRDAARYDPKPADFTDANLMRGVTDGELFYKISEGKKPMPVFKTRLTEDQRWALVVLIRSFASPRSPEQAETGERSK
jgi:mono/diheme cytochrome c family protein